MQPAILTDPSPSATPFVMPLPIMPTATPVSPATLNPPPDPLRHQRYQEFFPAKFYTQEIGEFKHVHHTDAPYANGSWSWGFNGNTPGETFHCNYNEAIFVRRINNLPPLGSANVRFALSSPSIHLHNAHTASESDGIPQDFTNPGEFWDRQYCNIYAGNDTREAMGTLWYHDHRLDFTGPNVYAGLTGFYLLFDEKDSGNEVDPNPAAFRLPSGKFDVPLILHDVKFDQNGQAVWDFFNPEPNRNQHQNEQYTTSGMMGDRFTVNRVIQPFFQIEAPKYRLRVLNGGSSRFYELSLNRKTTNGYAPEKVKFDIISTDGNLLPHPLKGETIRVAVAQRHDIVVDFSKFNPGDQLYFVNNLEMRPDGAGPTGRILGHDVPDGALALVAIPVFLGHLWPVFFRFIGGEGVATALGVSLGIDLRLGLLILAVWLVVAFATRYSSVAALVAIIFAPLCYGLLFGTDVMLGAVMVMSALLIYRHRVNIGNLMQGNETRLGRKNRPVQ